MHKRWLWIVVLVMVATLTLPHLSHAQDDEKEEDLPVLVWMEYNPWAMVIGSDTPRFALYESGKVIFWNDEDRYQTVQLNEDDLAEFWDEVGELDAFFELDEYYDAALMTDQPSHVLHIWQDGEHYQVGAYGSMRNDEDVRAKLPEIYVNLYDIIDTFSHPDAEQWEPELFELILWEYDTDEALDWPDNWPDFEDENTVFRNSVVSLYFDPDQYLEFQLIAHRQNVVRLNDQTWVYSWRLPFPEEERWMSPDQFEDDTSEDDSPVDNVE